MEELKLRELRQQMVARMNSCCKYGCDDCYNLRRTLTAMERYEQEYYRTR